MFPTTPSSTEGVLGNTSQEEINYALDSDGFVFVPEETVEEQIQEVKLAEGTDVDIRYNHQFTDEEGNIYPIDGDNSVEPYCEHNYVSGTSEFHNKYSDGSCEVRRYKSQRCSKCGYVLLGDWLSEATYAVCQH